MTALVASRPEMPGYNQLDLDDVQTPSRYCHFFSTQRVASSDFWSFCFSNSCTAKVVFKLCCQGLQTSCKEHLYSGHGCPGYSTWISNPVRMCSSSQGLQALDHSPAQGPQNFAGTLCSS